MTINFTTLFTRLGKLGKNVNSINTYRGTTNPAIVAEIDTQYAAVPELVPNLENDNLAAQSSYGGFINSLQTIAQNTVISTVNSDDPQPDQTLNTALKGLIAQMTSNSESIAQNTTSASTSAGGSNVGTGVVNVSLKSNDGKTLQMPFAEDVVITCNADSATGATATNERFLVAGQYAQSDPYNPLWPKGSGRQTNITAVSATTDASSGNLLTNSDFEDFTTNTPDHWAILNGAAGTEIFKETSVKYAGSASLKFVQTGVDPKIGQTFGDGTNGTSLTLKPLTTYAISFWTRADSVPASGTMTVRLYDVTGAAVMNDAAGTANQTVINLNTLTTSFANKLAVFRTPKVLPASYRLEVLANSIPASRIIYTDHLTMCEMTQLYTGGPWFSIHSGATNFVVNDVFTTTIANNYSSAWATILEKWFSLNSQGLIIPYSGSPTQAASLLS